MVFSLYIPQISLVKKKLNRFRKYFLHSNKRHRRQWLLRLLLDFFQILCYNYNGAGQELPGAGTVRIKRKNTKEAKIGMQLFMCNDHPVVRLGGGNYIVDTGSPFSFDYSGMRAVEIGSHGFLLSACSICEKEIADALTGTDIAGFIGMEILLQTGLTIDLENGTLNFACVPDTDGSAEYAELAFDLFEGAHIVTDDLFLRRRLRSVIVDTGARIPYLTARLTGVLEKTGEPYLDISPQFGTLSGEYLRGDLILSTDTRDAARSIKAGLLPELLDRAGLFDGIVGVTALTDKRIVFDFERKVIRAKL